MFSNTCRVCATTSSPPTSRPSPSTATIPETYRKPPASTASVKCEIGSASPSTRISSRLMPLPRSSLSLTRGLIRSGSTGSSSTEGFPEASARSNAASKSSVRSTRSPCAPIRLRERGEVRVLEVGADHASRELPLLVHADRRVHPVVDEEHDDRELVLHGRRELGRAHHEVAVAREAHDDPIRMDQLRRDGRGQPVPHRARARTRLRAELRELARSDAPRP